MSDYRKSEYRKRIEALKVGDPVIVRAGSGEQWRDAIVMALADHIQTRRGFILGGWIKAAGLVFSYSGSVLLENGRTSGCRCIVPVDMWEAGTWKPGALPPPPRKDAAPCVDCKSEKTNKLSPRCPACRQAHAAKKKIEYKKNRKEQEARYLKWQMALLP